MSYAEYLQATKQKDSFFAFKWWRIEIFHQTEKDAITYALRFYNYRWEG